MRQYIHQLADWPRLSYRLDPLIGILAEVVRKQGTLLGRAEEIGFDLRKQATLQVLTEDVVQTSAIEGETLNALQVRSSVGKRLGIDTGLDLPEDRRIEGVVSMMLDATSRFAEPLTAERLWMWHAWLFPTGYSATHKVQVGRWRSVPVRVLSGAGGREIVHFEGVDASRVKTEMEQFLAWFNDPARDDTTVRLGAAGSILRSGMAHLWLVTIHPFDDGNGRISRAVGDMLLASSDGVTDRFYSMSSQIRKEKRAYYEMLERTQKGMLDITEWMEWYLTCLEHAIDGSSELLESVLFKAAFWRHYAGLSISERQRKLLNHLLDGFEGNMTADRWAHIAHCSRPTALREINDLIEKGMLVRGESRGRSTHYLLAPIEPSKR